MDDLIADALIEEIENSELDDKSKHNRIFWIKSHRQNPAQSEDDEYNLNWIINDYERASQTAISSVWEGRFKMFVDWLKSLKERMKGK